MAISAGNYLIHSALDVDLVLLTSGGSKSKGAVITCGALTEADNRCYWKIAVKNTSYNQIYNIKTGTKAGNIMVNTVDANKPAVQGAYSDAKARWLATASGNTVTVHGSSVSTYFMTAYGDSSLYLTVPDDGGNLYLSALLDDTTNQEFWFEQTTYFDSKLATPSKLLTSAGKDYIVKSGSVSFYPQWNCAKSSVVYEMRTRSRQYDMTGTPGDWSDWSAWAKLIAEKQLDSKKKYSGVMKSTDAVSVPTVDNSSYLQADVEVQVRLTSATTSGGYNKTGTVTHGAAVSGLIRRWIPPTITISGAICTQYGLQVSYSSNYSVSGNTIRFESIKDGVVELLADYSITNQDYEGDLVLDWDLLSMIPIENDEVVCVGTLLESNGIVSGTISGTLTVSYDEESGFAFTPEYSLSDRMTVIGKIYEYDQVECFIQQKDLDGKDVWVKVEEIQSGVANHRLFEIIPAFGVQSKLMWVVAHTSGGDTQWRSLIVTLSTDYVMDTDSYVWNWVDDEKIPHCFILKYRAGAIMQPNDTINLPANKFVTTARDYPVFRYSKSISRILDVAGSILNSELGTHSTREVAEMLGKANHAVYRQPNGKWYQVALKSVAFQRQLMFDNVQITQEAESR